MEKILMFIDWKFKYCQDGNTSHIQSTDSAESL